MDYTLLDLQAQARAIGRGVVFYAPTAWDALTDLALTHLGDTEGDISVAMNESYVHLTTPELTGAAKHKSYVEGEDPVVTLPLYMADPALRAIITPTGNASGGYGRRRPVVERTVVIFPEELFFDAATDSYLPLGYTGEPGVWTVGGAPLTAEQQRLLGLSMWFWRGYFSRPPVTFKHADAGKSLETATFQVMPNAALPDGERLYTLGDPSMKNINIEPVVL